LRGYLPAQNRLARTFAIGYTGGEQKTLRSAVTRTIERTMKCTRVADRAFGSCKSQGRNRVISDVRRPKRMMSLPRHNPAMIEEMLRRSLREGESVLSAILKLQKEHNVGTLEIWRPLASVAGLTRREAMRLVVQATNENEDRRIY
jgi:hypothetical protein